MSVSGAWAIVRSMTTQTELPDRPAEAPAVAVRASNATKHYGDSDSDADTLVRALGNIDIDFNAGQFTSIMGPSGSGKSTLMHCLAGLDQLTSGHIWFGGTDLSTLSQQQLTDLRRDHIGFVFQAFNLIPTMTARENITLPLDLAGTKPDAEWFEIVVDSVGLAGRLDHRPSELSGGQQQRVAVARAMVGKPDVIFADEPTGNLDSRTGKAILSFLKNAVAEFGQTIIMVTHDPVAATYADRVVFLQDGTIENEILNPRVDQVLAAMNRLDG